MLNLYRQLVIPHIDYAVRAWSPFMKEKFLLEQVQRRATWLIQEVRYLPNHDRVLDLPLLTVDWYVMLCYAT